MNNITLYRNSYTLKHRYENDGNEINIKIFFPHVTSMETLSDAFRLTCCICDKGIGPKFAREKQVNATANTAIYLLC